MRRILALAMLAALATTGYSQQTALLSAPDATALFKRSVQLIESTSAAVPGLVRAAAPVLENARQAQMNLASGTAGTSTLTYDLLTNVRAYLALADSVPKPYPFPEEARKQFSELRDVADRMESHFRASLDQSDRRLRSPDRDNLRRYAEDDARLPKPAPDQKRIVFLGDSITDGWRLNEYFPGRDFVNRGISGQITGEMLGRMKADVIDLKPAGMLVLAGTNDIARGVPLSTIENNLIMIADLADTYRIKPLFASVLPISDYHKDVNPRYEVSKLRPPAAILELNRWIESFCKQRHYPYVDYFSPMVDQAGFLRTELADDGLHPNSAGYRAMGPIALDAIDRNIARPTVAAPVSKKRAPRVRPSKPAPEPELAAELPAPPPKASAPPSPAPAPAVQPAPAPEPVTKTPATKTVTKTTETKRPQVEAADSAKTVKKKKEPFWKRTYPSTPPPN